jgi:hypothetical protein
MALEPLRDELHHQIDNLPADVLAEVADFTAFVIERRRHTGKYSEWSDAAWRSFALDQLLRDADDEDVEYTLDDAEEIYQH